MLKAIGFIALVYVALQVLGFGGSFDWHGVTQGVGHGFSQGLGFDNPLAQLAGGILGLLVGAALLLMVIGLVIFGLMMAAGLPLLLLFGLIALVLMPALLPLVLLAGLFMLVLGSLGCLFA